jgi:DNA end-binding protein Ku
MAARAMGTGTISFGLVAIPIKLYSTGESAAGISFNWLHGKCGGRVKQQYFCPTDEEVVERKDLVKGYEFAKDRYVVMDDEELARLVTKATNSVDIVEFVPVETVDPIFFERSYYLGPDKNGDRPYKLLAEAMKQSGRVALARYAARGKNYLVLLRPFGGGLVMQQLRYADEVKSFDEVPVGDAEVKPAELQLARQLIDQITHDRFQAEEYKDDSREEMREILRRKIEGQEVTEAPVEQPKGQIIDLMQALKASLGQQAGEARRPPKRSPRSTEAAAPRAAVAGERSPRASAAPAAKRARKK